MSILPIRIYGDPVLQKVAAPVAAVTPAIRQLAADMAETMYDARGIGLAANQVGETIRVIVIDPDYAARERGRDGKRLPPSARHPRAMINPEILEFSDEDSPYDEGCLSIPGIEAEVFRPVRIRVRWQDLDGAAHEESCEGMTARVIQHEVDHLDGKLFVDRIGFLKRSLLAGRLHQLKAR